ncbi:hypothetical protein LQZ21_06520 [Treponema sp. TIM-1]|uniref:hypothetical protein n=1 Tax=Treponema sp. TIM-1 TaxID=2898417 RepID=UPI0039806BDF
MSKIVYSLKNGIKATVICEDDRPFEKFPKITFTQPLFPDIVQEYDNKGNLVKSYKRRESSAGKEIETEKPAKKPTVASGTDNAFQRYYQKWEEETALMPSSDMFENANYKAIIAMGWKAVPYIIEQLRKKPCQLFNALRQITGVYPIKSGHVGLMDEMAKDWIEWYDSSTKT